MIERKQKHTMKKGMTEKGDIFNYTKHQRIGRKHERDRQNGRDRTRREEEKNKNMRGDDHKWGIELKMGWKERKRQGWIRKFKMKEIEGRKQKSEREGTKKWQEKDEKWEGEKEQWQGENEKKWEGGNTNYPKIQTIAKTPNLTEFLNFCRFSRFLVSFSFFHFLLALPRSSSLFLALARSCSLALPRSSSLFLALPHSSPVFLCCFFFCFSFCFVHFRFWRFVFALFCSFSVFFSNFHVFSLCFALSRFLSLCLPSFVFFSRSFAFCLSSSMLWLVCSYSLIFNLSVWRCFYLEYSRFFFCLGGGACLCHMCFLGSIFVFVA